MLEKNSDDLKVIDDPVVISNESMNFVDPKFIDDPQIIDDLKTISNGIMDLENPKVYGYTCLFDSLVFKTNLSTQDVSKSCKRGLNRSRKP